MRTHAFVGATLFLATAIGAGAAAPLGPTFTPGDDISAIVLVQEKKTDTITQRVKRAWKDLVGYKFDVACPFFFPVSHRICTETGKDRTEARGKCAAQNQFCLIADAK